MNLSDVIDDIDKTAFQSALELQKLKVSKSYIDQAQYAVTALSLQQNAIEKIIKLIKRFNNEQNP